MKFTKLTFSTFCSAAFAALALTASTTSAAEKFTPAPDRVTPLFNDGSEIILNTFTLSTSGEKTLKGISIDTSGTTTLTDIAELKIIHIRRAGDRTFADLKKLKPNMKIKGDLAFPRGGHKFKVVLRTKKNADLLHKIHFQITAFHFADGTSLKVENTKQTPQRLAYPIHRRNDHNCHTFRIPAIARANNGDLLSVYDMRYNSRKDLQEHMDIGLSVSKDGGQTWSPPRPIMDMGEYGGKSQKENGCSDPGIIVDRKTGEVMVTACWTHGKPNTHQWVGKGSEPGHDIHKSTQFMVVRSKNHGKTWGKPENLTKALKDPKWVLFAPAPGNGITMKDGTLVMPTQGRDEKGHPFSNITWSKDHGKTWTVSPAARDNTTECAVAQLSDGSLMLNMRDNRNRRDKSDTNGRAVGTTTDLGKTWKKHSSDHGTLPEPTCMASLISHTTKSGKHILLFSNPNNKNSRSGMTIQLSEDDGKTWKSKVLLDTRGGAYSSLVMIDKDTIGILYESSVADMIFQKVKLSELLK